jgi:hypothetical protein
MADRYTEKALTWNHLANLEHIVRQVLRPEFPGRLSDGEASTLRRAAAMLQPSMQALEKNFTKRDKDAAYESLRSLLQAVEAIGALAIMTESQKSFFEPIVTKENRAAAGRQSGKVRKQNADKEWRAYATKWARHYRQQDPSISQNGLADAILEKLQLPEEKLAHETLRRFIASEETAGRLQPKTKKKP